MKFLSVFARLYILSMKAILLGAILAFGSQSMAQTSSSVRSVFGPAFSPDNRVLAFTICLVEKLCSIALHDISTGKIRLLKPPDGEEWKYPRFSRDGRFIAFETRDPDKGWFGRKGYYYSLAIMNADGTGIRKLTKDDAWRASPTFSPDGTRLIYIRSDLESTPRRKVYDNEIWEIDIATGEERRILDINFYGLSQAEFLPDGKQYVVAAEGWHDAGSEEFGAGYRHRKKSLWRGRIGGKNLDLVRGPNTVPNTKVFVPISMGGLSGITGDGSTIAFLYITGYVRGIKYDYDLFIQHGLLRNSKVTRVTGGPDAIFSLQDILGSTLRSAGISLDGRKVAFTTFDYDAKEFGLWVGDIEKRTLERISLEFATDSVPPK